MTNRQWLMEQMQNMSDEELAEKISIFEERKCEEQECRSGVSCAICKANWLKAEHGEKPKLKEAERVILENIPKEYKWIVRCANGDLMLCAHIKPTKIDTMWLHNGGKNIDIFNHLFQFTNWNDNEPYEIAELLKGE